MATRNSPTTLRACAALLAAALITACGSSDENAAATSTSISDAASTTEPVRSTTAPETSAAPTTSTATTVVATTQAPPTTAAPTTQAPPTTSAPTTTVAPTTTAAPATTTVTTRVPPEPEPQGFSLPVGGLDGVTYEGGLVEQTTEGPSSIAIDHAGGVHIADQLAGRIISFRNGQRSTIDVAALGVLWISDIVPAPDHLIVLEDFQAGPLHQRAHRITFDGQLLETVELNLPPDFVNSVRGLVDTGDGKIVLELPDRYRTWDPAAQMFQGGPLVVRDTVLNQVPDGIEIGDMTIPHDATSNNQFWAGLRFHSSPTPDVWILDRWDGRKSLEWWSADGTFLGAALVPIEGVTEGIDNLVAVSPDGRAFVLVTRAESVDLVELVRQPDRLITP